MKKTNYLSIHPDYKFRYGQLRWSKSCDAIEFTNGKTFILIEQLSAILDGVYSTYPRIIPFECLLDLLQFVFCDDRLTEKFDLVPAPLKKAFRQSRHPGKNGNLGILIAKFFDDVPQSPDAPDSHSLQLVLKRMILFPEPPDPLEADRVNDLHFVENCIKKQYGTDFETLRHWIEHGAKPPTEAAEQVAEALEIAKPVERIADIDWKQHPRLADAASLVPALDAALSLPPRKLQASRLPMGGYTGVINRGHPDRLLPSQFALEADDFIRRFAENELLYYRREDPHRAEKPVRVFVLDQGVRTWGMPRLVLAGAVISALKKEQKKFGSLHLAFTSAPGDILVSDQADPQELIDRLEASDLSVHPTSALEAALASPSENPERDFLLLTHPRACQEPRLRETLKDLRTGDRLFVLGVEESGRAELSEWRGDGLIPIRNFRVSLDFPKPPAIPKSITPLAGDWKGTIETVRFPFSPGLIGEPEKMALDADGNYLMMLARNGALHLAALDGSVVEIVPLPFRNPPCLEVVDIAGMKDGFAVLLLNLRKEYLQNESQIEGEKSGSTSFGVVYYNLLTREVNFESLIPNISTRGQLFGFPDLNAVVVKAGNLIGAFNLESPPLRPNNSYGTITVSDNVMKAYERVDNLWASASTVTISELSTIPGKGPWLVCGERSFDLLNIDSPWLNAEPKSNGIPIVKNRSKASQNEQAQYANGTLVWHFRTKDGKNRLHVMREPGRVVGEKDSVRADLHLALSANGRRLAVQKRPDIEIYDIGSELVKIQHLSWAALHQSNMDIKLYEQEIAAIILSIQVGYQLHIFRWYRNEFSYEHKRDKIHTHAHITKAGSSISIPNEFSDGKRFRSFESTWVLIAALDTWGQVVLATDKGIILAHFLVRSNLAAIMLPDGTAWGSPVLLGCAPTPDAATKIGNIFPRW